MFSRKFFRNLMHLSISVFIVLYITNVVWSLTPNDTYYYLQEALDEVESQAGWEFINSHEGIPIAIIDNGYQSGSIPDLESRLVNGWDFVDDDQYPHAPSGDNYDHGTKMASVIAAVTNNSQGVAGMSWGGQLIVYRVYSKEDDVLDPSKFKQAVYHAIDHYGVRIINASVGHDPGHHPDLRDAVDYAVVNNCLIIGAAGNDSGCDLYEPRYISVSYPAAYSEVLSVGSVSLGRRVVWSNTGAALDLVAPESIYAVIGGGYEYAENTSASTALTTGIAALILANNPSLSYNSLLQLLVNSCDDLQYSCRPCNPLPQTEVAGVGWDSYTGHGRINLFKALTGLQYTVSHKNSPTGITANPGDYIDFWTITQSYVGRRTLSSDDIPSDGYFRWNGLVDDGTFWYSPAIYIYKVNGGSEHTMVLEADVTRPIISNAHLTSCQTITFDLTEEFGPTYIYLAVFDSDGKFDRFDLQNVLVLPYTVELTLQQQLTQGESVKVFGIDVAGNLGHACAGTPPLIPPENLTAINDWNYYQQYQRVKVSWNSLCAGDGTSIERRTSIDPWGEVGTVSGENYFIDYTALGSESYEYRARTYEGGNYSPYSNIFSLLTLPQIPTNVIAITNPEISNNVVINWSPPMYQKPGTISNYSIRRLELNGGNAVMYGPYTSGPVKLCEDIAVSHTYIFGVRTNDIYAHHSIFTGDTVATGSLDWCVGMPNNREGIWEDSVDIQLPEKTSIGQNYPNPFNNSTTFPISLANDEFVNLVIYNIAGQKISTIVDNEKFGSGFYSIQWSGKDQNNQSLASGVYYYLCTVGQLKKAGKLLLIK